LPLDLVQPPSISAPNSFAIFSLLLSFIAAYSVSFDRWAKKRCSGICKFWSSECCGAWLYLVRWSRSSSDSVWMHNTTINITIISFDWVRSFISQRSQWSRISNLRDFWRRHYSCSNGDTWSSELGVLSSGNPILITSFKRVQKGTNGGVSSLGMIASVAAGFVIGVAYFISSIFVLRSVSEWPIILVATIAAPVGSLVRNSIKAESPFLTSEITLRFTQIDSILGATLQYSAFDSEQKKVVSKPGPGRKHISGFDILDNHQVNFLSILITMAITPLLTKNIYSISGLSQC
jgi:uncharacterized membrane protein